MANKAVYQAVQSFIEWALPIWQERLGLGGHTISVKYLDTFYENDDAGTMFPTCMITHARWQYAQAKIYAYLPSVARLSFEELEGTLVHELWHVVLAPEQEHLPDKYAEHWELATENATRITLRAYEDQLLGAHYGDT
jgi:hypothetical protein